MSEDKKEILKEIKNTFLEKKNQIAIMILPIVVVQLILFSMKHCLPFGIGQSDFMTIYAMNSLVCVYPIFFMIQSFMCCVSKMNAKLDILSMFITSLFLIALTLLSGDIIYLKYNIIGLFLGGLVFAIMNKNKVLKLVNR